MMTSAPNWEMPVEQEDDPLTWLREFLSLTPEEEREIGYILDIRYFLPTDILIQAGANLVLIGMGLR